MKQLSQDEYNALIAEEADFLHRLFADAIKNGGSVEVSAEELLTIHINRFKWIHAFSQDLQNKKEAFVDEMNNLNEKASMEYQRGFDDGNRYGIRTAKMVSDFTGGLFP